MSGGFDNQCGHGRATGCKILQSRKWLNATDLIPGNLSDCRPDRFDWHVAVAFTLGPWSVSLYRVARFRVHSDTPRLCLKAVPPTVIWRDIWIGHSDFTNPTRQILADLFVLGMAFASPAMQRGVIEKRSILPGDDPKEALIQKVRVQRHSSGRAILYPARIKSSVTLFAVLLPDSRPFPVRTIE